MERLEMGGALLSSEDISSGNPSKCSSSRFSSSEENGSGSIFTNGLLSRLSLRSSLSKPLKYLDLSCLHPPRFHRIPELKDRRRYGLSIGGEGERLPPLYCLTFLSSCSVNKNPARPNPLPLPLLLLLLLMVDWLSCVVSE